MTVPTKQFIGVSAPTAHSVVAGRRDIDLLSRLTIRARLIARTGMLLCLLVATNFYLMHTLTNNSAAVTTETELSAVIESANGARIAFGEMRYWLTDLAVSQLTMSERNAAKARDRMEGFLDQLAVRKPEL